MVLLEREPALGTQTTAAGAGFVGYGAGELEAELAEYGMRFYMGLAERAGSDAGVRRVGLLFPALSAPGVEMLRQEYERELGFAPDVVMIDTAEAVRMAPILDANGIFGALHQPDAHSVDTVQVMAVLAGELERAGVDVRTGVAAGEALVSGGRVTGVRTSAGEIPAGAVVNAAGASARAVGARNGVDIAAVPLLESRFTTEPVPGVGPDLPMMLFFERDLLYLREQAGGLLVGAIEHSIGPRSRVDLAAPPRTADLSEHAAIEQAAGPRAGRRHSGARDRAGARARERPADVDAGRAPYSRLRAGDRGLRRPGRCNESAGFSPAPGSASTSLSGGRWIGTPDPRLAPTGRCPIGTSTRHSFPT